MGGEELVRLEHPQADVDDDVWHAAHVHCDQRQAVAGGDGVERFGDVDRCPISIIGREKSSYSERTALNARVCEISSRFAISE